MKSGDDDEVLSFDMKVGFASHAEVGSIDPWLIGEGSPVDEATFIVGFVVIEVGARPVGAFVIGDAMAKTMDEIFTIPGLSDELSSHIIGLVSADFSLRQRVLQELDGRVSGAFDDIEPFLIGLGHAFPNIAHPGDVGIPSFGDIVFGPHVDED